MTTYCWHCVPVVVLFTAYDFDECAVMLCDAVISHLLLKWQMIYDPVWQELQQLLLRLLEEGSVLCDL